MREEAAPRGPSPFITQYTPGPGRPLTEDIPSTLSPGLRSKQAKRARMADLLDIINAKGAGRLRGCGPGSQCGMSKWCPSCGLERARGFVRSHRTKLLSLEHPYHLTATSRAVPWLWPGTVRGLIVRFRRFRESRIFRRMVAGGLANVEIAHGHSGWLPHVHAILDCRAEPSVEWMRERWRGLGGGYEVDLRKINPGEGPNTFAYSLQRPELPDDATRVREFYWATRGVVLTRAWGSMRAVKP